MLLDDESTKTTCAITWLHVIRWHSEFLKPYINFFSTQAKIQLIINRLFIMVRYSVISLIRVIQGIFHKDYYWSGGQKNLKQVDVLFISHLTNRDQIGKEDDTYFGSFASQLQQHVTSLIALIDHTKSFNTHKELNGWSGCSVSRVVLSRAVSFGDELSFYLAQQKERRRLKSCNIGHSQIAKKFISELRCQVLSPNTASTLRVAKQIQILIKNVKPKCVVVTYEGQAWERLVCSTIKEKDPSIQFFAYQHAAVFKFQHSMMRKLQNSFNPDVILTSGNIAKQQLEERGAGTLALVRVLGSEKSIKTPKTIDSLDSNKVCLVVPEGIESECNMIFEFSIKCAIEHPNIQFIWRLHPFMNFTRLIDNNNRLKNLPNNIILSTKSLVEDVSLSSYVLYRGSTAVVHAISSGVVPIYLSVDGEQYINPLYECKYGNNIVQTISDFKNVVQLKFSKDVISSLKDYGSQFYTPFNKLVFLDLLEKR